ncbi:MAG TPA: YbaN family protein [Dehalococcoidia bacterium]
MRTTAKRKLLIGAGTLSTGLGIIGVFVPILPTTPFLLLAAACYMRSSERFYQWLMNNKIFGDYVRNYIEGRGMPMRIKIFTILLLWLTIGLTITFGVQNIIIRIILICIAIGVTAHIVLIKKRKVEDIQKQN